MGSSSHKSSHMSSLVLDEKKIDDLVSSYQYTENLVIAGSDEHLDQILNLQKALKSLIDLSVAVSSELESAFNSLNAEQSKNVVVKLSAGLGNAWKLIKSLKTLPKLYRQGIKSRFDELILETEQIEEFVQDLIKYKITDPEELKVLLASIK